MKTKNMFYSDIRKEMVQDGQGERNISQLELQSLANTREDKDAAPSSGKELHNLPTEKQLVNNLRLQMLSFIIVQV